MRDWFSALRSGGYEKDSVPGVPGVAYGNRRLNIAPCVLSPMEHRVTSDVFGCADFSPFRNDCKRGTLGEPIGVPFVLPKIPPIIGMLSESEHQEHKEHNEKHECGAVTGSDPLLKIVTADQLSSAERSLFCLDHELMEYGGRCPNKEKPEGCVLWDAIRQRLPVIRPEIPRW